MLGLLSSLLGARNQRHAYDADAALLEQKAAMARSLGQSQRRESEKAAAANLALDAENLRRAQSNKNSKLSSIKAQQGGNGFDLDSGSKRISYDNAQENLDMEIENMARSAAISYSNMFQQGVDIERQAEIQAIGYEGQARQARAASRSLKRGTYFQAILGVAGAAAGAYTAHRANMEVENTINEHVDLKDWDTDTINRYRAMHHTPVTLSALQGLDYGGSLGSLYNPFTSALNADSNNRKNNWNWLASTALGQTPYRVKEATSPYGFAF